MNAQERIRLFEHKLVHHCAPTLAGVKPSSMFTFSSLSKEIRQEFHAHVESAVSACGAKVAQGGVLLSVLLSREASAVVLVYRPDAVDRVLQHAPSRTYLAGHGYDVSSAAACIESLRERFEAYGCLQRTNAKCARCEFPHEVGILLGYPYEDVMAFIKHEGRNGICRGHWKVYSDEESARSAFDCFKEYTRIFDELFAQGTPIEELALLGKTA